MWKISLIRNSYRLISSLRSNERFNNDLLRKRLIPYLDKTSYVDQLIEKYPKLKASVLLPIYFRSYTGMVVLPGGMSDLTDRDIIHTVQRKAEEEIGLKSEYYSILGCLPPITDSPVVMILDFDFLNDQITEAFYLDKYHIWGVTAFELIIVATIICQQLSEFPFIRHQQQLDLKLITKQLKVHFQICVNYIEQEEIKQELDDISRLK